MRSPIANSSGDGEAGAIADAGLPASGAEFLVEVPEEHSRSSGTGISEPALFFKQDALPVRGMIRQHG
jgi:hypothetical protein